MGLNDFMTMTTDDFNALGDLITQKVEDVFEQKGVVTKEDIKHLPTKEQFYDQSAKIMKELKDIREEKTVLGGQVSDHSDRIEVIENKLGITPNY